MSKNTKPNTDSVERSDGVSTKCREEAPSLQYSGVRGEFQEQLMTKPFPPYLYFLALGSGTSVSPQIWSQFFPCPLPMAGSTVLYAVTSLH